MSKLKLQVDSFQSKQEADSAMLEALKQFPAGSKPIMCQCEECGGIGFAQDEMHIDKHGYLIDMKCPCGGRIKKMF
jgi:hypothetical protein